MPSSTHLAIAKTGNIKHLGSLVNLRPETILQNLLCVLQGLVLLKSVKMGHNTKHTRESVRLDDIEELKGLHLEAKASIHHQQDKIGNLSKINHSRNIVWTLDEGQAAILSTNHGNRSAHVRQSLFGVFLDQRLQITNPTSQYLDQCRLSDLRRSHNHNYHRGIGSCRAIGKWVVNALESAIEIALNCTLGTHRRIHTESLYRYNTNQIATPG